MRIPWVFEDPVEMETYEWVVNPNSGGTPAVEKSIGESRTTAQDGQVVFYQGVNEPQKLEFSGVILSQTQLEVMTDWASRDRIISITDDLGREYRVVVTRFVPERVRKGTRPYYHTYQMTCMVMP